MYRITHITTPLLLLATAGVAEAKTASRPNVVMILADDMGFECMGANGSTYKTPTLDRLSQQGMRFTNCHAQPLSTPTRIELMTGLYNNRNYISFGEMELSQRTFGHMAREAGYKTCIAGKWQLGLDNTLPAHFGFDKYCLWQLSQTKKNKGSRYAAPTYEVDGKAIKGDIDAYGPDIYSDYICDFISENRNDPMFIYYPMALIHAPFNATPLADSWSDPATRLKGKASCAANMVEYADKMVAKIVDKLKAEGVLDNTVILFVGDNGTVTGVTTPMKDGSMYKGGKKSTKRNGTHVPMVVSWQGKIKGGVVNENLVDVSDFYPTIRDIIGGDASADRELDGVSFYKQLLGRSKSADCREWCFSHYPDIQDATKYMRFAQTADYKLYSTGRFYNTRTDADEVTNIVKSSATAAENKIREMLQGVLDSYPEGSEVITRPMTNITE